LLTDCAVSTYTIAPALILQKLTSAHRQILARRGGSVLVSGAVAAGSILEIEDCHDQAELSR